MKPEYYSLLIQWDDEDKIYVVSVPELPGARKGHVEKRMKRQSKMLLKLSNCGLKLPGTQAAVKELEEGGEIFVFAILGSGIR